MDNKGTASQSQEARLLNTPRRVKALKFIFPEKVQTETAFLSRNLHVFAVRFSFSP